MDIEINLESESASYQRGRELAKAFLHSSSKPEQLVEACREMLTEVFERGDASILGSAFYNLAMVSVGLRRALELEEDPHFADEIVQGLWSALEQTPVPPGKAQLKIEGLELQASKLGDPAAEPLPPATLSGAQPSSTTYTLPDADG